MAASSNRNESYIIKDLMMTLMTWYSSFLYQIIMDSPQQLARTTFSLHNHGTDHNHQETQHMMTIRSTTQYTVCLTLYPHGFERTDRFLTKCYLRFKTLCNVTLIPRSKIKH
eukprot:32278_1